MYVFGAARDTMNSKSAMITSAYFFNRKEDDARAAPPRSDNRRVRVRSG